MRIPLAAAIALFLASGLARVAAEDEPPPEIPAEWRVVVETKTNWEFRHQLTIALDSTGAVTETVRESKSEPKTSVRKVDQPLATKGLHLVWSVLEDASLFGGRVEDGDMVTVALETKNWTWSRFLSTSNRLRGADHRLPLFVDLMRGKPVDDKLFRTKHGVAAGMQNRWTTEWNERDRNRDKYRYIAGGGSIIRGDDDFFLSPNKSGWHVMRSKKTRYVESFEIAEDPPPELSHDQLVGMLTELRKLCVEREPTGDREFGVTFHCGGSTTLRVKGLKSYAEAGPLTEAFFTKAEAALPKGKVSE